MSTAVGQFATYVGGNPHGQISHQCVIHVYNTHNGEDHGASNFYHSDFGSKDSIISYHSIGGTTLKPCRAKKEMSPASDPVMPAAISRFLTHADIAISLFAKNARGVVTDIWLTACVPKASIQVNSPASLM